MKTKFKQYIKEIITFVVMVVIISNVVSYYKSIDINKTKLDIENISTNGEPIVIHFWSTWCPICKVEAPNIENISQNYNVITIAVGTTKEKIKEYLKENNLSFKVINDENSLYANRYNISVYPTTLIYDKDKDLIFSEVGYTSTLGLKLRLWWAGL